MIQFRTCKRKGCSKTVTLDGSKKEGNKHYCGKFCKHIVKTARDRAYYHKKKKRVLND